MTLLKKADEAAEAFLDELMTLNPTTWTDEQLRTVVGLVKATRTGRLQEKQEKAADLTAIPTGDLWATLRGNQLTHTT